MFELKQALKEYAYDVGNPEKNLKLAKLYENIGQLAGAISFYLRTAEKTLDKTLSYYCLLKIAHCFELQGGRNNTVRGLYKQAISLLPQRPEGYFFLSRHYEYIKEYTDSYMIAELGLNSADFTLEKFQDINYPGKYGILFEKAVSAWWWGKSQESRDILKYIATNYKKELQNDKLYYDVVQNNIMRIGLTPRTQSFVRYDKSQYNSFRLKFSGLENITENYSQCFQDLFVLTMLNGKKNGSYLEIGSADPIHNNNTYILEKLFGWKGVGIDYDKKFIEQHKQQRNHTFLSDNALKLDYDEILSFISHNNIVDYLQLDCEPASITYDIMIKIPFHKYKFAVITYEHDHYADIDNIYRNKSREFLINLGYQLVVHDVSVDGVASFEDWYVHPDLVDSNILGQMTLSGNMVTDVLKYFTGNKWYAEFNTDQYIREKYFPDFSYKGIFVDVGAGPANFINNSKHFRDSGWRTISIEPNQKFVKQHELDNSEVYQYACADFEGESEFIINYNNDNWYSPENDGVSFSSLGIRYNNVPEHNTQEKVTVKVTKLSTLLENISVQKIDVLSIDTEGWELDVLRGFDHIKYDPKVIVIENFENNNNYETFMKERGYKKDIELGYNHVYVKDTNLNYFGYTPSINKNSRNRIWIVDNFYENPDEVRQFALNQVFNEGGIGKGYIGRRTAQQYLFPGLKEKFEEIMGKKIIKWEEHGMNGRFQISWAGEPLVYHCDNQRWAGMLYLTPNAPFEAGTTLYAHKKSRVRDYYDPRWTEVFPTAETTHLDKTPFEPVDVAGNVYNRLIIFDASSIHSASEYFGQDKNDGRLWHMFFFD